MKIEPIHKDVIVVGSSLSALVYAFANGCSFLAVNFSPPHEYNFFSPDVDLGSYGLPNFPREVKSPSGEIKQIGLPKSLLWHRLNWILSLSSNNIMPFEISQLKIEDNILKVITSHGRMAKFVFSKLIIFDETNINLPVNLSPSNKFKLYDWIRIDCGKNVPYDFIHSEEDIAKDIWFYKDKDCYNWKFKNLIAISYATFEDLNTFEWTDTGVMFKSKNIMKLNGIRGRRNGRDTKYPGKYKYYALKLIHEKRDIESVREGENIILDNIEVRYDNDEDLIRTLKIQPSKLIKSYNRFLLG